MRIRAGICWDGPWKGDFLSCDSNFKEAFRPGFGSGEYCFNGNGRWYWRQYPPL
jgi:hypothetical protein